MAKWWNNWQGIAPGTLTVANSADGGWSPLNAINAGTFTVSTAAALTDPALAQGLVLNPSSGNVREARVEFLDADTIFVVGYVRRTGDVSVAHTILQVRHPAGASADLFMQSTSNGRLVVRGPGGTALYNNSASNLAINTWYRFELRFTRGTTSGDGQVSYQLFVADETTPQASFSSSAVNTGTNAYTEVRFGRPTATTTDVTVEHWGPLAIYTDDDDPGGHGHTYAEPVPPPVHQGFVWDGDEWVGVTSLVFDGADWVDL